MSEDADYRQYNGVFSFVDAGGTVFIRGERDKCWCERVVIVIITNN